MQLILNGDTRPILFFLAASSDHVTGLTGATATVTISKNGGAFGAPGGTVAEVGVGWYKLTPSGSDATTNGVLLLHATATGADPADVKCQVVAFSPYDAGRLGLSALPNASAGAAGGLPIGDASGNVALATATEQAIATALLDLIDGIETGKNATKNDPGHGGRAGRRRQRAGWHEPGFRGLRQPVHQPYRRGHR